MCFNMMATASPEVGLEERLVRLRGGARCECVPGYRATADRVQTSREFLARLAQFKALADEHRLLAVALLKRREELCACEIQAATGLNHATVSHHMSILVEANLVTQRREGKWIYYRLNEQKEVQIP